MRDIAQTVGTYNVFITSQKETAVNLLASDVKSFAAYIKKHSADEGSVYLSTAGSKQSEQFKIPKSHGINLLEFTHTFNYSVGGKGASKEPAFKIKTQETGLEFLKELFFLSTGQAMSFIKERKAYMNELNATIARTSSPDISVNPTGIMSPLNIALRNRAKARIEEIVKNNANGQRVYISYGVGDDLAYWAGPFSCFLGETEYGFDGKKETMTYSFGSDHVKRSYKATTGLDSMRGISTFDDSGKTGTSRFNIPIAAYDVIPINKKEHLPAQADLVLFDGYTPSIHDCVVKLISFYLDTIGIRNHLIVLPNLDKLLSPTVTKIMYNHLKAGKDIEAHSPQERGIDLNVGNLGTVADDFEDSIPRKVNNFLFEAGDPARIAKTSVYSSKGGTTSTSFKDYLKMIPLVFQNLGFVSSPRSGSSGQDIDPRLVTIIGGPDSALDPNHPKKTSHIDFYNFPVPDPFTEVASRPICDTLVTLGLDLTQWSTELTTKGEDGIDSKSGNSLLKLDANNWSEPIVQLVQNILTSHGEQICDIDGFFESNLALTSLWKDKFGNSTFEGYKHAKGNRDNYDDPIPSDTDDSYFVFGDRNLIDQYLYGGIQAVVEYNKNFRSSTYLGNTQHIPVIPSDDTFASNYMLDPFWNCIRKDVNELSQEAPSPHGASESEGDYLLKVGRGYFSSVQKRQAKGRYTPFGFFNDYATEKEDFLKVLPDEFGFLEFKESDEAPSILDQVYALKIPFFIANDKNANILSINMDADNFILSQFMGSIGEIYHEVALKFSKLSPPVNGIPSHIDVDNKIYEVLDRWRKKGFYGKGFHKFFPNKDRVEFKKLTTDLTDVLLLETRGLNRRVRAEYTSPYVAIVVLFAGLFRQRFKGVIKTLPMFNISNVSNLNKPIIVQINNTKLVQTPTDINRSSANFFSGVYKILGLKHTIKNTNATSEFVVVKDIEAEMNDAQD